MLRYAYALSNARPVKDARVTMVDQQIAGGNAIVLQATGLSRSFKGLKALSDYNLSLSQGEILGVIGPNGAGKTTLFNVITGFVPPDAGDISLHGGSIVGKAPDAIVRAGIARTFQNIRLFSGMSVLDNVLTAQQVRRPAGFAQTILSLPVFTNNERRMRESALSHLRELGLDTFADHPARSLPYGLQRKLEIARAIATEPAILLLDEPAAGMNAQETAELTGFIREIRRRFDLTIIVVEHDMSLIMRLCDRIQVLNYGRIIAEGTPGAIRIDPAVIEAYLGAPEEDEVPVEEAV
jgi:branched-chain amino acid transport system ATP-binding protein